MATQTPTVSENTRPDSAEPSIQEGLAGGVVHVNHPLVQYHVTKLRDETTAPPEFRNSVRCLAELMAYEATKDLPVAATRVQTPLAETDGVMIRDRIGLVPILRAGLSMVDPVLDLMPTAEVWHLGLYRDEATAQPVRYYDKLPVKRPVDVALILDPMLATGGSVSAALTSLREWGVPQVKLCSVIAAPEGVEQLLDRFPETQLFVCRVDQRLDQRKFILPGLGDAGDRIFNTPTG
jgi:uracil phosphoribosyltransferase